MDSGCRAGTRDFLIHLHQRRVRSVTTRAWRAGKAVRIVEDRDLNIVLIGMPGVGKSTVGVLLAKTLTRNFLDTDVAIQSAEQRRIMDIIQSEGAEGFCSLEEGHVLGLDCKGCVIATGGSVVYSEAAMGHLRAGGLTVHLLLPLERLSERLSNLDARGVVRLQGQSLDALYEERMPLYSRNAVVEIDCSGLTHEQVVDRIVAWLTEKGVVRPEEVPQLAPAEAEPVHPPIGVQQAVDSDFPALVALDKLVPGSSERRSSLSSAIASKKCYKAVVNGEVLGFIILEETFYGHAFISFMIVHPGHRREGIATALITYAESVAPTDKLFTSTNASNTEMQRLCEAQGFTRSGAIENLDDEDHEIVYFKQIKREGAESSGS